MPGRGGKVPELTERGRVGSEGTGAGWRVIEPSLYPPYREAKDVVSEEGALVIKDCKFVVSEVKVRKAFQSRKSSGKILQLLQGAAFRQQLLERP